MEAIFCANDLMALGVMDCGRLKYKYVPGEDYSIMGLDDTFAASLRSYSLTVLQQQNDILCKEAVPGPDREYGESGDAPKDGSGSYAADCEEYCPSLEQMDD